MTVELLLLLGGLSVLDSLSPATLTVTIVVLLSLGRRSWLLLAIYWGTIMVAYFVLGVLLMLGLGAAFAAIDETMGLWIQAVIGVVMLVGSFFIKPGPPRDQSARLGVLTPGGMLALGLGTWGLEAATAVPYFAAITMMTSADIPPAQWLVVLLGYVMVMMLPGVVIAVFWTLFGERLRPRLEHWLDKLRSTSHTTISWIVGIAGFVLLQGAAWQLALVYGLL